ncbi:peptidoglycan-binding domain-containing protein [Clostridium botulinum]|uniref:peptidoglycan-binding domain-containing protein n=1 Tax=Clostridium botulinum TaxID=1491 RepID=UPI0006A617CD|nr:peptidoglycan-binding protein [Clostridium botulinum]
MILKKGSRGDYVICLQNGLTLMCIDPNGHDGIFGAGTENAVIRFQKKFGLDADGIVGQATWEKLKDQIRPIQSALTNHNYKIAVDGVAGRRTIDAVKDMQKKHGLNVDGMVGGATWKILRATSGSHSGGIGTLEIANKIGLFKYLIVHCNNYDIESPVYTIHPNVTATGKISLAHTIGNSDMSIDLSNRRFSSGSVYSGNFSADFNKDIISQKNIKSALDSIGVKLADLQGGTLRAKLVGPCYSPNNFVVLLEYSTSVGNITVYQTLKIHYTNFTNNTPQYSSNTSVRTAGVIIIGAVVGAACIALAPAATAEILTAIATLASRYNLAY